MGKIVCDICDSALVMEASGESATCQYCGMKYSVGRIKALLAVAGGIDKAPDKEEPEEESLLLKLLNKGDRYFKEDKLVRAEEFYKKVLTIDPVNDHALDKLEHIEALKVPVVGKIYRAKVARLAAFGAFVELIPSGKEGLVHISKLSKKRPTNIDEVASMGEIMKVSVLEIDHKGRMNLAKVLD